MLTITYYHQALELILTAKSIIVLAIALIYGAILAVAFEDIIRSWRVRKEDEK